MQIDTVAYPEALYEFATPRSNSAWMFYRQNTNDWNTLYAAMVEDEYQLGKIPQMSGYAVDIGAHIGSVGIGLAIDNPNLQVICVEPVPDNIRLLYKNIEVNALTNVMVLEGAAGGPNDKETTVDWGYIGQPHLEHHAFVGNTTLIYEFGSNPTFQHQETVVKCFSLSQILEIVGEKNFRLLKIDCEGCEYRVLADPAANLIDIISGEWHTTPVQGGKPGRNTISELLPNHNVSFSGPEEGPGGFFAVHK